MDQHGHREEQPHEIILAGQRRGDRHQAEQYADFLGVRPFRPARCRRHDRDIAEPDDQRYRQHDQVRRLEIEIGDIHRAHGLRRIVLIVVHRPRQPVRHRNDGLVDPRPVLLVALTEPLLRTRPHHAAVPGLQLRDIMLEAAERCREHEQKHSQKHHHAGSRRPLPTPYQIRKHGHRKNLDGGREREHAARHPSAVLTQQPESVQHQRQQHEVRLAEIEHVEHEGDGDKTRQRFQPRTGFAPRSRHGMRILRGHPPRNDVEKRQAEIKRDLAEEAGDREQHRRERRIDEFEIGVEIAGIEVLALQHLLPRPEP